MPNSKLNTSFYRRDDVVQISRELVGKLLCTQIGDAPITKGIITETEAYCGRNDKACHANNGLRTDRTEVIYHPGGRSYVYLCYGIHHLFNVVTNVKDMADAILVRAVKPVEGIDTMLKRRDYQKATPGLTAGPGRCTQALGITTELDETDLTGHTLWIEESTEPPPDLQASPRIGVDYAGEHAKRPWRFTIQGSKWISSR